MSLPPESERRTDEPPPPLELAYGGEQTGTRGPSIALFQFFAAPLVVAAILSVLVSPTAGLVGMIASAALLLYLWKGKPGTGIVLRMEGGSLDVVRRGKVSAKLGLEDLVNVRLDIKTIQRVQEGDSAIPAMRFIDSKVGPDVDTARIVLVTKDGKELALTDDYLSHMDSSEWMGKIRVFLRKHGWVPGDER